MGVFSEGRGYYRVFRIGELVVVFSENYVHEYSLFRMGVEWYYLGPQFY